MKDLIKGVRISVSNAGNSELLGLKYNDSLKEFFRERQRILVEMNLAKKIAIEKAAEPFLKSLEEIDKQYAMILSMISTQEEPE